MRRKILAAGAVSMLGAELVVLKCRRGFLFGANTVVRCRSGHMFTTIWIPGASLKAVRLGWWRWQRCPVGNHWSFVTPVNVSDLTGDEAKVAAQQRDVRVP